jgi:hypothetical protein
MCINTPGCGKHSRRERLVVHEAHLMPLKTGSSGCTNARAPVDSARAKLCREASLALFGTVAVVSAGAGDLAAAGHGDAGLRFFASRGR